MDYNYFPHVVTIIAGIPLILDESEIAYYVGWSLIAIGAFLLLFTLILDINSRRKADIMRKSGMNRSLLNSADEARIYAAYGQHELARKVLSDDEHSDRAKADDENDVK